MQVRLKRFGDNKVTLRPGPSQPRPQSADDDGTALALPALTGLELEPVPDGWREKCKRENNQLK